jgi:hypothetical protein
MNYLPIARRPFHFFAIIILICGLHLHCQTKNPPLDKEQLIANSQVSKASRKLMNASSQDLSSIAYTSVSKKMHVVTIVDGAWHYAGMELLEPALIDSYIAGLSTAQGADYVDSAVLLDHPWQEKLIIEGAGLAKPVIITAYQIGAHIFLLHSTEVPDIAFRSDSAGLYKQLFTDLSALLP